jgi:membrane-bound lytic murein transglycosylase A
MHLTYKQKLSPSRMIMAQRSVHLFCCLAIGTVVLLGGCTLAKNRGMYRLSRLLYPGFADDLGYDGLAHSIRQSIDYFHNLSSETVFRFDQDQYTASHMIRSLEHFLEFVGTNPSDKNLKKFIRSNYRVYKSVGNGWRKEVLFTGYYEPFLQGSRQRTDEFRYPILARPDDLVSIDLSAFSTKYDGEKIIGRYTENTVVPYYDRREIEQEGALEGKAEVLAWLQDPVDLFFLQIQGSGRIFLDSGQIVNVHYHDTNGKPYRSIGKLLIEQNKISRSEMSMQKIRAYLRNHPEEVNDILNHNPSYVFFKTEEESPLGFLEVKLTPGRSIAVDRRLFPLPALAFIKTKKPIIDGSGQITRWIDFSRFVMSQDTGGAIRGAGRSDLFWGNGMYAEVAAGHMQHKGYLYFLVLKPDAM